MTPVVPVLRLNPKHREDIARHLLQLPANDRRLRFGNQISDQAVRDYVDGIDFARDHLFGIHGDDLSLIGVAHLALDPAEKLAEIGVSVDPTSRGKGFGYALLHRSVLHAANLGYRTLFMVCLAENRIMMHLARKAGLTVVTESGEADARLTLDRLAHGGIFEEAIADQLALVDGLLKQQYLWLAKLKPARARSDAEMPAGERRKGALGGVG
jgi:RimJ/RimL family protein N-acetyltransferase